MTQKQLARPVVAAVITVSFVLGVAITRPATPAADRNPCTGLSLAESGAVTL